MTYDLVVHGGTVVNAGWSGPATVVVSGGTVVAVQDPALPLPPHERALDAGGRLVIPGGVDPHCHIGQRLGDYQQLDDYASASVAALHGGTTTVVDFAIPEPGQAPLAAVQERRELASASRCDTAMHGCVIAWEDGVAKQLAEMAELGVRTVKMFTTYRDVVMAGPDTVLEVLRALHELGGIGYVHAEANHVIEDAQEQAAAAHRTHARHHSYTRPELAEAAAVTEVLATAEHVGAPVYFVHQTTAEAVDLVRAARRRGVRAYTETCPHYLTLDSSVYDTEHPERFVCCPPLRGSSTVAALRARALAGDVDTLGSDHCCYSAGQKAEHRDDVRVMPNGLPGVETRLPVAFTELVARGGMPVERFVALFASNPARLNGLTGKGVIAPGADADLVVLDPSLTRTADANELHMATDYTPYQDRRLVGWPEAVVSAGRVVLDADGFHDPGPVGRALAADPIPEHLLT
ncbi:amidohydrolase family protein [Pseudonocardia acaciae]|uniref:amidohydrolase family protein n=1 Tax=Pseudonocardia acaciae TaxID=551276 RepID=UPI00048C3831|nr:amidohydrolase family protein [Pseudonocardia acaciae]